MFDTSLPLTSTSISDKVGVRVELALTREPGNEKEAFPTLSNF